MPEDTKTTAKPVIPVDSESIECGDVLHPDDSVETAGERMRASEADALPVVEDAKLVGMLDEKNPDWEVGGHGHDPAEEKVGDIMTRHALYCHEDDDCAHAEALMRRHGLSHLAVVDRQMRVVGIFKRR